MQCPASTYGGVGAVCTSTCRP